MVRVDISYDLYLGFLFASWCVLVWLEYNDVELRFPPTGLVDAAAAAAAADANDADGGGGAEADVCIMLVLL